MPTPTRLPAVLSTAVLAAGLLAGGLSACSVSFDTSSAPKGSGATSAPPTDDRPSITVPTPSVPSIGVPTVPVPEPTDGGTGEPAAGSSSPLPPRFPLPAGATPHLTRDDAETAGTIDVTDPEAARDFWVRRLPGAGYTVDSADSFGGLGEIRFHGHGCGGNSQLAITGGTSVMFQCDRTE